MTIHDLDHVNIRTARLAEMVTFYSDVLGLAPGARPPFGFAGAWLYCGDKAAVHLVEVDLVEVDEAPGSGGPRIEHFAFMADGLARFLTKLREQDVSYRTAIIPGIENRQVHLRDPDGTHIEIQFAASQEADPSDDPGP